jgi:ApeA N-terminal domain 1
MRVQQPWSLQGYFWLPARPELKLPGTLRVSDIGRMELEVLGMFGDVPEFQPKQIPLMHGVTENGKLVTLANCITYGTTLNIPGIPKSRTTAERLFVGLQFPEADSFEFTRVTFSLEGLDVWVGLTGISVSHEWDDQKLKAATITFRPPAPQSYGLGDGLDLSIQFRSTFPFGIGNVTEAKVTQTAFLQISSREPRPLDDLLQIVHRVNTFLCLALDEPVALSGLVLLSPAFVETVGEKQRLVEIDLYFPSLPHPEKAPTVAQHRLLFPYRAVAQNLGNLLSRWLADYEVLEPAFNLYFASTTAQHAYVETRFLFLAQGLETFHRRTSTQTVMLETEFQSVKVSLLSTCPQEHHDWLETRLAYANELSLRQRLKALMEPISQYFGQASSAKAFISQVVATRNYLTHYDKASHEAATSGETLLHLSMKLEAMFMLLFLRRIGFSNSQLEELTRENYRVAQKLRGEI